MEYFDDISFRVVVHRYFTGRDLESPFTPASNSLEMIRSGRIFFYRNGEKILLEGPVLFWMKCGERYQFIRNEDQKRSCEHLYFDCAGNKSEKMIAFLEKEFPAGFLPLQDPGRISSLFVEMVNYYRLDSRKYLPELNVLMDSILLEILRSRRRESPAESDPYHIRTLGDEIRKNPFLDFDFNAIAARNSITRYHLSRLFRQIHKMPPGAFVLEQRMIRAAELLRLKGMQIKDVMFNCRYTSSAEFSRAFKRYSGHSPREYRRLFSVSSGEKTE